MFAEKSAFFNGCYLKWSVLVAFQITYHVVLVLDIHIRPSSFCSVQDFLLCNESTEFGCSGFSQ